MTQVVIRKGTYRNQDVSGLRFTLVRDFVTDAKGGNVVVANGGTFPGYADNIRVRVDSLHDIEFVNGDSVSSDNTVAFKSAAVAETQETDEAVMTRIRERFDILTEMTKACISGDIRAMIVSGPPGVGKSFGIEQEVEKAQLFDTISNKRLRTQVVKGSATPIGLYQTLFHHSDENCLLVFDDCDSILLDDVSLNLLKGALDSGKKRTISWLSESSALRREGIPDRFEFKGSVIFITNLKFDQMKSQKLRDHLDALQSRCHYLDLTLDTMRDKILRIRQIAQDGMLFQNYDFTDAEQEEVVAFMEKNQTRLREMSLRMALKIADLRKLSAERWTRLAETTCMKMGG
jgi:hypothetical protein